ncbi:hypothetical protein [Bacteroides fluxus]|jgi:hypothetical protein|uniref:hypothetical protein n=1 Tax=Bacteroides fluxus TaxID=626930 RepID=UPI002353181A|nr:hypothetical protein [Bacteroides fluxus]
MKKIAIIGSGAYGSYAASLIAELHANWEIHIFEAGDHEVKNQDEMGFYSEVTNGYYGGLIKGRYFGFGGSTNKWGGQILTFSDNDFKNPTRYQKEIIELNKKYRTNIFKKVGIKNDYPEVVLPNGMFTKTGVWLDYFSRNLFKKFKVAKFKNVILHPHCRVCKMIVDAKKITGFTYIHEDCEKTARDYDYYFLAAGAFETTRIMMISGLQDKTCVEFSDHINKKVFRIFGDTQMGPLDFTFHISKASFITQRIIGEKDGIPFFAYPTYNEDFPFFQNLKKLLFGKKLSLGLIWSIFKDLPSFINFIWCFFILRKLYVYKTWYFVLHMENLKGNGKVALSKIIDKFGQPGLSIDFHLTADVEKFYNSLTNEFEQMMKEWNVKFERLDDIVHTKKFEDEYHPCGLYSDFNSVEEYFTQFDNMIVIHSGVLPHAGGINSTAAAFPLVEEFIRERMQ